MLIIIETCLVVVGLNYYLSVSQVVDKDVRMRNTTSLITLRSNEPRLMTALYTSTGSNPIRHEFDV